jgi:hypothetical protein
MPCSVAGLAEFRDIPVEVRAGFGQVSERLVAAALRLQSHGKHELGRDSGVPTLAEGDRRAERLLGGSEVPQTVLGQARDEK